METVHILNVHISSVFCHRPQSAQKNKTIWSVQRIFDAQITFGSVLTLGSRKLSISLQQIPAAEHHHWIRAYFFLIFLLETFNMETCINAGTLAKKCVSVYVVVAERNNNLWFRISKNGYLCRCHNSALIPCIKYIYPNDTIKDDFNSGFKKKVA